MANLKSKSPYQYRGAPNTHASHSICGHDKLGGSGVLEWCFSCWDAEELLEKMKKFPQFEGLHIESVNGVTLKENLFGLLEYVVAVVKDGKPVPHSVLAAFANYECAEEWKDTRVMNGVLQVFTRQEYIELINKSDRRAVVDNS